MLATPYLQIMIKRLYLWLWSGHADSPFLQLALLNPLQSLPSPHSLCQLFKSIVNHQLGLLPLEVCFNYAVSQFLVLVQLFLKLVFLSRAIVTPKYSAIFQSDAVLELLLFTFLAVHPDGRKECAEQLIVQQEILFHFQETISVRQDFPVLS